MGSQIMPIHSMWKGSLSFGLVNIPVEMRQASRGHEFKFILLHDADYSPIRYARICREGNHEVPWEHIVKGYESEKGKFIVMSDDDFEKASTKRTDSIDIKQFVDEDEIDPIYFEKPYYLEPQKGASKAYALLVAALKKSKKVGIGIYVLHQRQHLGLIKAQGNLLVLIQLRYENEIIDASNLKIPKSAALATEVLMAVKLIENMSAAFLPEKYKDSYTEEMRKIIKRKAKGEKIVIAPKKQQAVAKVYDLMSALKASIKEKSQKRAK